MGRVYKALLKAERSGGDERPVGSRPFGVQSAARPREQASPVRNFRFPDPQAPSGSSRRRPESLPEASVVGRFDFNEAVSLSETTAASQRSRVAVAHSVPVAPAPPGSDPFVEPHTVLNANDLNIGPHSPGLRGDDGLASERYKSLGIQLRNLGARRKLKSIVVTSSEEGEGKSTIASNIAWSLAKPSGRRVLLLDANPNSSTSLSRVFGVNTVRGWKGVADGRCQFAEAAVRLNPNGLYLLMQGSIEVGRDSEASDALISPGFEKLIARLERDFDLVILDSPPILESNGAQRLASLADGTVFVVRAGRTPHNAVTEGLKLVPRDRQLGLVLNESELNDEIRDRKNNKKTGRRYLATR